MKGRGSRCILLMSWHDVLVESGICYVGSLPSFMNSHRPSQPMIRLYPYQGSLDDSIPYVDTAGVETWWGGLRRRWVVCGGVRRGVQSLQLNDKACISLVPAKLLRLFLRRLSI